MTAWTPVVVVLCLLTKCGIDFLGLEYGSKFRFVSDDVLFGICFVSCFYAICIDALNFICVVLDRKRSRL